MAYDLIKVSYDDIVFSRERYLAQLSEFQAYYFELLIQSEADYYQLIQENQIVGHTIIHQKDTLVEFYLPTQSIPDVLLMFSFVIKKLNIKSVLCKSFDGLLLSLCLYCSFPYDVFAYLFRHCIETNPAAVDGLYIREATLSDLPLLLNQEDELFATGEEAEDMVKNGSVILFYQGIYLIGCGFLATIHQKWPYCNVGMWTHPRFRQRGVATKIVSYLKVRSISEGKIPIAGCHQTNKASKRALEKNGFIAQHSVINFYVLASSCQPEHEGCVAGENIQ